MKAVEIILSDARGVYIPRDFVEGFDLAKWGLPKHPDDCDIEICANGPDEEGYWEAWENILSQAKYEKDGNVWRLHQDGDLFAYCYELMTDDEKYNFGFEDL